MGKRAFRVALAALMGSCALVSVARAAPALTFTPPPVFTAVNGNQSVGWQFDVLAPTTVIGLGWFDDGGNGLSHAHQVGIWDPSGILLASATIPAGAAAPFDGQFRTVFINAITLPVASGYIVGGENFSLSDDRIASNVPSQTLDPRLRYIDATFGPLNGGFVRPATFSVADNGFYGPSFSVPEPGAAFLLGIGAMLPVLSRARPRRR